MNTTLRWVKFEALMIDKFFNNGIRATFFKILQTDHISELEIHN